MCSLKQLFFLGSNFSIYCERFVATLGNNVPQKWSYAGFPLGLFIILWIVVWLGSCAATVYLAKKQGYNTNLFGFIGFLIGLSGYFLTLAVTRKKRPPVIARGSICRLFLLLHSIKSYSRTSIDSQYSDSQEIFKEDLDTLIADYFPELLKPLEHARKSAHLPCFLKCLREYFAIREEIETSRESLLMAGTILLWLFFSTMKLIALVFIFYMPTFVSLFEGMNLTLPFPTKILCTIVHIFSDPYKFFCLLVLWSTMWAVIPALLYNCVTQIFRDRINILRQTHFIIEFETFLQNIRVAIAAGYSLDDAINESKKGFNISMEKSFFQEISFPERLGPTDLSPPDPCVLVSLEHFLKSFGEDSTLLEILDEISLDFHRKGQRILQKFLLAIVIIGLSISIILATLIGFFLATSIILPLYQII